MTDALELAAAEATHTLAAELIRTRSGRAPTEVELVVFDRTNRLTEAELILADGWRLASHPRVKLIVPVPWDELCAADRSWAFHLQAWEPLADVIAAYAETGERRLLDHCLDIALDWARRFPRRDMETPFGWYDMAIGMRAFRLAYLIEAAAAEAHRPPEQLALLVACLRLHLLVLADDREFKAHSNHGIYQAAGQLTAARRVPELPESPQAQAQAEKRLLALINAHFNDEGVHLEHSPGYHLMVLRSLLRLQHTGIIDEPGSVAQLRRAQDAMAWLVAPVGTVPTVGDSDRRPPGDRIPPEHISSPSLLYALTDGAAGVAPERTSRAFPAAGYVSVRNGWPRGAAASRASYLLQSCGFHSRVHKHPDDLSFVWYADGQDLLTDGGRYGYAGRTDPESTLGRSGFYYGDPARIHVESTRSHNCVEIDGRSYPRRRVQPYGSALRRILQDEEEGVIGTESQVTQFRTITITRLLFHRPDAWVLVVDHVFDRLADARHDYAQRFLFGPELERLEITAAGTLLLDVPDSERRLAAIRLGDADPIAPVRGQQEPELAGFASRRAGELLPAWTAGWRHDQVRGATFGALFLLIGAGEAEPAATGWRVNATARRGRATWTRAQSAHALRWDRHAGNLLFSHAATPGSGTSSL